MKIFLDTAEIKEIEAGAATGLIDGITTNPSLVAKSGQRFEDLLRRICELVHGPISAEVTALDAPRMIEEGRKLAKIHRNITVKVPLTFEGLKACRALSSDGTMVNVTLCFNSIQAVLAAKSGATFVSPFVGRLDDIGEDGMQLVREIKQSFDHYGYKTQILAASIRHPFHVLESLRIGAHVATMPYKVFQQLTSHPLTDVGLERFLKDWENAKK